MWCAGGARDALERRVGREGRGDVSIEYNQGVTLGASDPKQPVANAGERWVLRQTGQMAENERDCEEATSVSSLAWIPGKP